MFALLLVVVAVAAVVVVVRDVVLGTCTGVVLEYSFEVLVLVYTCI